VAGLLHKCGAFWAIKLTTAVWLYQKVHGQSVYDSTLRPSKGWRLFPGSLRKYRYRDNYGIGKVLEPKLGESNAFLRYI
jgi:hypothetical protein